MLDPMKTLSAFLVFASFGIGQVTIKTTTILDGKGRTLKNQTITVVGAKIGKLGSGAAQADYDLTGLTVLPGWIDTHVHITWHFDRNNRLASGFQGIATGGGAGGGGERVADAARGLHDGAEPGRTAGWGTARRD